MRFPGTMLAAVSVAFLMAAQTRAGEPPAFADAAFAAAQRDGVLTVIETWAPWCLPCKIQAPIMERLQQQAEFRKMRVLRIGEGAAPELWRRFRLTGYGMIVVYRGGREVARGTPTSEKAVLDLLRARP